MKMSFRVKKYLNVISFLSSAITGLALCSQGRRMLTPKAVFWSCALVSGLHDARSRAGDHHEPCLDDFSPEINRLLIFLRVWFGAGRTEDGNLALVRKRREQPEGIAQFPQRRLDDPHVTRVLYVLEQLQAVFDDVGDFVLVIAAAFVLDQFLNPPRQFLIHRGLFVPLHVDLDKNNSCEFLKGNQRLGAGCEKTVFHPCSICG